MRFIDTNILVYAVVCSARIWYNLVTGWRNWLVKEKDNGVLELTIGGECVFHG